MSRHVLHIVTGAPGAGKSTVVEAFLDLKSDFIAFDIDWLIESASDLAGTDLHTAESKWPTYRRLWLDTLHSIFRNGRVPVLFAPWTPSDLKDLIPPWCSEICWLLLDCSDAVRRKRLEGREGWADSEVQEALADASYLRSEITDHVIDTGSSTPDVIANTINQWLMDSSRGYET